jgi:glycosyltransferase involved in cell wall biosynthesis
VSELRGLAAPNVRFPGYVTDHQLEDLLGRAKAYVQASFTEGFGLSLVEAMSAGCVPVVTAAGALPEVVGDTGFYVDYDDDRALANAVRRAMASDLGERARARVLERFTLDHRLAVLKRAVLNRS